MISQYKLLPGQSKTYSLKVFELIPSFLTPLMRSLVIRIEKPGDQKLLLFEQGSYCDKTTDLEVKIYEDETQNFLILEVFKVLEEGQFLELELTLEKRFKQFQHFPNDPQRGHDYLSSLIQLEDGSFEQTNALLIFLNEPDFSMPFNVIAVTSAVIGFLFISVFNLTMQQQESELNQKKQQ